MKITINLVFSNIFIAMSIIGINRPFPFEVINSHFTLIELIFSL